MRERYIDLGKLEDIHAEARTPGKPKTTDAFWPAVPDVPRWEHW